MRWYETVSAVDEGIRNGQGAGGRSSLGVRIIGSAVGTSMRIYLWSCWRSNRRRCLCGLDALGVCQLYSVVVMELWW